MWPRREGLRAGRGGSIKVPNSKATDEITSIATETKKRIIMKNTFHRALARIRQNTIALAIAAYGVVSVISMDAGAQSRHGLNTGDQPGRARLSAGCVEAIEALSSGPGLPHVISHHTLYGGRVVRILVDDDFSVNEWYPGMDGWMLLDIYGYDRRLANSLQWHNGCPSVTFGYSH